MASSFPSTALATLALSAFALGTLAQFEGFSTDLDGSSAQFGSSSLPASSETLVEGSPTFIKDDKIDIKPFPLPFPCPIVLCAGPKPGCTIVFDDLVDSNGCAVNPCGIEVIKRNSRIRRKKARDQA